MVKIGFLKVGSHLCMSDRLHRLGNRIHVLETAGILFNIVASQLNDWALKNMFSLGFVGSMTGL